MENMPPLSPDKLGVKELGGFTLGETVLVEGLEGEYKIAKLFDQNNMARVRREGAAEEDTPTVPLDLLKKVG